MNLSRRAFLKLTAAAGALVAVPAVAKTVSDEPKLIGVDLANGPDYTVYRRVHGYERYTGRGKPEPIWITKDGGGYLYHGDLTSALRKAVKRNG